MTESVVGKLVKRLASGAPVLSAWVGVNEPMIAELLAREDFDVVMLDLQHGAYDFMGVMRAIGAVALAGKPSIARIPVDDFATASRILDAGAAGIIAPMINCAADARRLVEFTKYPPLGERSWGPRAALALSGMDMPTYLANANALVRTIAMVETREALAAIDEILGVEGIDGIFIGPSDLSVALSDGASLAPRGPLVMAELPRIVERARAHGKFASMFCFDGADANAMIAKGFQFCSVGTDQLLLRAAARIELAAARSA